MTISPGFTAVEVREFVHEYQLVRYGQKARWLVEQDVPYSRLRRWQDAVFEGDLDRALIPREGSAMTMPPKKRTAFERARAVERGDQAKEVARLSARVRELEETNTALGKAIGLLHAMSEEEPENTPTPTNQPDS
ncbi:hypothetical protein [Salinibacterium sp.]|uniref:hypothetical protein n=2 Tax=Salinibacterium sp. TaxID=1915057 RepID=UPI00286A398C|nr:hypothetical protein [Salinibacterium sp.]